MVAIVANDRRFTAFVLSMFKTNAKVLRSDLERGENAVGSRRSWDKRRNISMNVVHAQYTRGKEAAKMVTFAMATSWRPHHDPRASATTPPRVRSPYGVVRAILRWFHHCCAIAPRPHGAPSAPMAFLWGSQCVNGVLNTTKAWFTKLALYAPMATMLFMCNLL